MQSSANCEIAISEHERKQVMGHWKSDTFDRDYLSQNVRRDVQKLYQGQAEFPVVRIAAQMKTYMDPRAPYRLSSEQRASLRYLPEIVQLRERKTSLSKQVRSKYGSLSKVIGTGMYDEYKRARLDLQAEYRAQDEATKVRIREEYFNTIHTQTLERQLAESLEFEPQSEPELNPNAFPE